MFNQLPYFPEVTLFSQFPKNTYCIIGDPQKDKQSLDLRYRSININNNQIYLACAIKYVSTVLFKSLNQLEIVRKIINQTQITIIKKQSIPKYFWMIYNCKNLKKQILNLIQKLQGKYKSGTIDQYMYKIINQEPIIIFNLIILVRNLTYQKFQHQKNNIFLIGNQLDFITDFTQDAKGNVISLLSKSLKLNISIHFMSIDQTFSHKINYGKLCDYEVDIINQYGKYKIITKNQKQKTMTSNINKQNIINLQIKKLDLESQQMTSSICDTDRKFMKHKICHKCGRVKVQRFCICRKIGAKDNDFEGKALLQSSILKISLDGNQII